MGERTQWRPFLEKWSAEWIAAHDPELDLPLAPEVVRDGWLGFAPATEADVAAAEARLGRRLPPSLREFLLVTDGWRDAGCFVYRLAGTRELDWLRDTDDRSWIGIYQDLAGDAYAEEDDADADADSDEDGDEDEDEDDGDGLDEVREANVLARSLRLSLEGDSIVLLLDPDDVDEDGEWAAYSLSSWSGEGPRHHGSFYDLMYDEWVSVHALRHPPGATRDHWDAEVERARGEALAGAVEEPLAVFARAHDFGRLRADTLSLQMKMLLGDWQQHIADGMWYHDQRQDEVLLDPLFAAELLPLLVRHDRCAPRLALRPLPRIKQRAPEAVAALVADYEARAAEPGFRPVFGAPDFDAAVHAVADRLAADPAFRASAEPRHPDGPLVAVISRGAGPQDPSGPVDPSDPAGTSRGRSSRSLPERALVRQPSAADREALCARAWTELKAALRLWRPVSEDHIAPVSLLADPVLAELITPERGREILAMPRGAAAAGA